MLISLYDRVLLKTGEAATIIKIYQQGVAYEAEVDYEEGTFTETIKQEQIERII